MGLDGMVLLAFLLGFPANEIVLPILLMGYLHTGTLTECGGLEALRAILLHSGWTTETALCMMALCLLHFPCGTTCLTIRRETGGYRWTLLAMVLPTAVGIAVCMLIHGAFGLLGEPGRASPPGSLLQSGLHVLAQKTRHGLSQLVLPLAGETILR